MNKAADLIHDNFRLHKMDLTSNDKTIPSVLIESISDSFNSKKSSIAIACNISEQLKAYDNVNTSKNQNKSQEPPLPFVGVVNISYSHGNHQRIDGSIDLSIKRPCIAFEHLDISGIDVDGQNIVSIRILAALDSINNTRHKDNDKLDISKDINTSQSGVQQIPMPVEQKYMSKSVSSKESNIISSIEKNGKEVEIIKSKSFNNALDYLEYIGELTRSASSQITTAYSDYSTFVASQTSTIVYRLASDLSFYSDYIFKTHSPSSKISFYVDIGPSHKKSLNFYGGDTYGDFCTGLVSVLNVTGYDFQDFQALDDFHRKNEREGKSAPGFVIVRKSVNEDPHLENKIKSLVKDYKGCTICVIFFEEAGDFLSYDKFEKKMFLESGVTVMSVSKINEEIFAQCRGKLSQGWTFKQVFQFSVSPYYYTCFQFSLLRFFADCR